jgi:hypothetical protein
VKKNACFLHEKMKRLQDFKLARFLHYKKTGAVNTS